MRPAGSTTNENIGVGKWPMISPLGLGDTDREMKSVGRKHCCSFKQAIPSCEIRKEISDSAAEGSAATSHRS